MRVALVGPAWPHRGGIAHHTAALARALVDAGHDAHVLGYRRLYPERFFPGVSQFERVRPAWAVHAERLADPLRPDRNLRLAARIRALGPDAVAFQWWHPFFALCALSALGAGRAAGARTTLLVHNVRPHEGVPLAGPLVEAAGRLADGVVVQSAAERDRLPRTLRSRAVVVHHPPYAQFTGEAAPTPAAGRPGGGADGALRLLFFGLIRPYKGLDDLLEAVALARARGSAVELVVRGECYGEEAALRARVARPDLRGAVDLRTGYVPEPEVAGLFAAADAVALPYREATGSGVAALALAFGRPVVGTRVPGLTEVVGEGGGGFLSPVGDAAALAEVLERMWRVRTGPAEGWAAVEAQARRAAAGPGWGALVEAVTRGSGTARRRGG